MYTVCGKKIHKYINYNNYFEVDVILAKRLRDWLRDMLYSENFTLRSAELQDKTLVVNVKKV